MKKFSKIIVGVFCALLLATSAFAADTADKDTLPPPPPGMSRNVKRPPMPKLTAEQRTKLDAERRQLFADWQNMTPEQRREAHNKFQKSVRNEQMKNMTPAEKEKFLMMLL